LKTPVFLPGYAQHQQDFPQAEVPPPEFPSIYSAIDGFKPTAEADP